MLLNNKSITPPYTFIPIHNCDVSGKSLWFKHVNNNSDLIVNHYSIQSWNHFVNKKTKKGCADNWHAHPFYLSPSKYKEYFDLRDSNEVLDIRLKEQNLIIDLSKKSD